MHVYHYTDTGRLPWILQSGELRPGRNKIAGYPDDFTVRWNPLAVFLRQHGGWLLLLPVLWVFFATPAEHLDRGIFSQRIAFVAGVCIAGLIIVLFLYAVLFPYSRPFLFHVR